MSCCSGSGGSSHKLGSTRRVECAHQYLQFMNIPHCSLFDTESQQAATMSGNQLPVLLANISWRPFLQNNSNRTPTQCAINDWSDSRPLILAMDTSGTSMRRTLTAASISDFAQKRSRDAPSIVRTGAKCFAAVKLEQAELLIDMSDKMTQHCYTVTLPNCFCHPYFDFDGLDRDPLSLTSVIHGALRAGCGFMKERQDNVPGDGWTSIRLEEDVNFRVFMFKCNFEGTSAHAHVEMFTGAQHKAPGRKVMCSFPQLQRIAVVMKSGCNAVDTQVYNKFRAFRLPGSTKSGRSDMDCKTAIYWPGRFEKCPVEVVLISDPAAIMPKAERTSTVATQPDPPARLRMMTISSVETPGTERVELAVCPIKGLPHENGIVMALRSPGFDTYIVRCFNARCSELHGHAPGRPACMVLTEEDVENYRACPA